jgi:glucose/arabinose dehydrogenase
VAETTTSVTAAADTTLATTTTTRRTTTTPRPGSSAPVTASGPPVGLKLSAIGGLSVPIALAQAPNDDAIYVAEQSGRVKAIRNGQVSTVLDVSGQIAYGGEQGLLGLAFSPTRSTMVINYTDDDGDTHVDEYPFSGGRVTGGARRLLFVDQPYPNHNGGNVVFGPDNHLYVGMGDGGSAGDPQNHAQNPNDRLGKMLRIDDATAAVQIWMIGLRNPWRFSFDRATGDMWIGDVGQGEWEEIDFAPAGTHGQNWGWRQREGKHAYNGGAPPSGNVDPIYDFSHNDGSCAVTGGYVYRGTRLAGWAGTYLFADYCVGKVMALTRNGSNASVRATGLSTSQLSSFGETRNGDLYVMSLDHGLFRIDPA